MRAKRIRRVVFLVGFGFSMILFGVVVFIASFSRYHIAIINTLWPTEDIIWQIPMTINLSMLLLMTVNLGPIVAAIAVQYLAIAVFHGLTIGVKAALLIGTFVPACFAWWLWLAWVVGRKLGRQVEPRV